MRVLNPTFPANRPLVISYNPILNRKEAETAFSLGGGGEAAARYLKLRLLKKLKIQRNDFEYIRKTLDRNKKHYNMSEDFDL